MMRRKISSFHQGLSARLLFLTILFVMVVEVLIYVPSVAQFRLDFLGQRLTAAQTAALALEEVPQQMVSAALEQELLQSSGLVAVIVLRGDSRQMLLRAGMPPALDGRYNLQRITFIDSITQAFAALQREGKGYIQVRGRSTNTRFGLVEFVLSEAALYREMIAYSRNILARTIIISLATAGLVFLTLHYWIVRPMRRICDNMAAFRERPEDDRRTIVPSGRMDEIGMTERELARLQREIRQSLKQKERLASLGIAVSKINHDLRNILTTAQLWTDRLRAIDNPQAAPFMPRLFSSIDRAIKLCERTLKYGKADEAAAEKEWLGLAPLIDEVGGSLGLSADSPIAWNNRIGKDIRAYADSGQLFRIFLNLGRNAVQAMGEAGSVTVKAEIDEEGLLHIMLSDTGPGLPEKVRETLFVPFIGAAGGGTGLGLAIVRELVRAHGGEVMLEQSDENGTTFRVCLPNDTLPDILQT